MSAGSDRFLGLRVLLVPLSGAPRENPSDRRRLLLPSATLAGSGISFILASREEALEIPADIVWSQDRDYAFWLAGAGRLSSRGARLVFSFSDALGYSAWSKAHQYDAWLGKAEAVPAGHWRGLAEFLDRCCAHAVAGSAAQADMLSRLAPSLPVSVLYDAVDTEVYPAPVASRAPRTDEDGLTLFWEGCSDNLPYLLVCAEAVRMLAARAPVRVILATTEERRNEFMGTRSNRRLAETILGDAVEFHPWSMETVGGLMARADAGLAPLFEDCPFAAAKPANKAVICNWMGLPVVASPTRAYRDYVEDGVNGFLASAPDEWERAFMRILDDPSGAAAMGARGRRKAGELFSPEAAGERMFEIIRRVARAA